MPTTQADPLEPLRADPGSSAVFLDFDGTLSEIVAHPDLALPVRGAVEALGSLKAFRSLTLVTGRQAGELRAILGVEIDVEGGYGLAEAVLEDAVAGAREAAGLVEGSWVEPKGGSVAVHYRAASDPQVAHERLSAALAPVAERDGLELIEGKMVLELVPRGASRKGGVVGRILAETGVRHALYAGDDLPDIEAFDALDRAVGAGTLVTGVKVAVRGPETPEELVARADLVVEGPGGLVALLGELSRPGTTPGA